MRVIMHVDIDSFYASIEQRDNLRLRGLPIAVRLGKSEVIASASYEAKSFGVRSEMDISDAALLCPELQLIEADLEKYAEASRIFQQTCIARCREFEPYSVSGIPEEGWFDYTDKIESWEEGEEEAKSLKTDIRNNTGLTSSAGVAYAKIPAKMASDYDKPDGLTIVRNREEFASLFHDKGARDLFGVGHAIEKRLKALGIQTIGDIAKQSPDYLVEHFKTVRGTYLYLISRGIDEWEVNPSYSLAHIPKSIGRGKTVRRRGTKNFDMIADVLRELSRQVGASLRGNGYYFKTATVEISGFNSYGKRIRLSRNRTFDYHTNDWRDLYDAAVRMLYNESNQQQISVIKIGVRAGKITQEQQLTLFNLRDYKVL
ncbi:MAG: DNA polymerase IV [Candidatus Aenigmarchaeota archaeon]|nr:DNA polymerase IV [Candidatus Aenigmarchaeota archaeon]